jgi:anthranilate phosphoribosyltransferase
MKQILQKISDGQDMSFEEAKKAMEFLMSGEATDAQIGAFLLALKTKGETPQELAALAYVMRKICFIVS